MVVGLDEKDQKILSELRQRSKATTRQIARKTLLPPTTIHNRIRRMVKEGIIRRFTVELDPDKVGRGFIAYILISASIQALKAKGRTQYDVVKELSRFDFIERVDIVSGGTDIVAIVAVEDVKEFDKVLLGKIQLIDGIEKTQSMVVIHRS
ncbi:MAG: Lrp/AsnC family transcriptional regulator [Nanoarchaeota archaeon]